MKQTGAKRLLVNLLSKHAPSLLGSYRGLRSRQRDKGQFVEINRAVREAMYAKQTHPVVASGPFQGMIYLAEAIWGPITPKWLGCYEAELQPAVNAIIEARYSKIINIGCAEGYYAVGLAWKCPASEVIAFDSDFMSQRQCSRLAHLNAVSGRVEVTGSCSHAGLRSLIVPGKTVIVCDIEGGEAALLDPALVPQLAGCDLLVEVHENAVTSREVEELLRERFGKTHRIGRISARDPEGWMAENSGICAQLGKPLALRATDEKRSNGFAWLWMTH